MSDINDNADDYIIHVEIVDAVGDGGTFYGDHVVTGDPFINPPSNWEYGQLLFDGYDEDPTGGSGGGAGPHDHDEFAPVEHDHATETISPEIVNIRQGPFPENLVGMPEMAMYDRTGSIQMTNRSNATFKIGPDANWEGKRPVYNGFVIETGLEAYGESASTQPISIIGSGGLYLNGGGDVGTPPVRMGTLMLAGDPQVTGDLQVDGTINVGGRWAGGCIYNTSTANREFLIIGDATSGGQIQIYGNGDSNRPGKVSITGDLLVNGIGVSRFNVAPDIDTADVLDRAETETMPAPEEGVATTDADVDGLTVNEVVTALLAKVKELSAEIEELKGN